MRKPTLEEIKEYFKDAKVVKDLDNGREYTINWKKVYFSRYGNWVYENMPVDSCYLWSSGKYAEIIEYKEPSYTITKETILKYNMKDEFHEVFKVELEINNWYKSQAGGLWYVTRFKNGIDYQESFGINKYGEWSEYSYNRMSKGLIKATDEEVKEALVNEAKKRGFEEGVYFKVPNSETISVCKDKMILNPRNNSILYYGDYCIFKDGEFATILETISKEEAEKLLNKKNN